MARDPDPLKRLAVELCAYRDGWGGAAPWARLALARAVLSLEADLPDAMRESTADLDLRAWVCEGVGRLAAAARSAVAYYSCLSTPPGGDVRPGVGGLVPVPEGPALARTSPVTSYSPWWAAT